MEVIHIELEKEILEKTEGLLDEQIIRRSVEDWDSDIRQAELAIQGLEAHIQSERDRIESLRKIRARRIKLGD